MAKVNPNINLRGIFLLVTGAAIGFWLFTPALQDEPTADPGWWVFFVASLLGGLSLVGIPLLLLHRQRDVGRWGPGRLLWFASGTATWLLWPPIVVARVQKEQVDQTTAAICYLYGTPLMAIWVVAALLAGRWLRPKRRKAKPLPWTERFGLILGLLWACTGFYMLYLIYAEDFD